MKIYRNVYFRINAPSYYKSNYGVGFENQQERDNFYNHVTELFLNDGWILKEQRTSNSCPTVTKDKQELYLHPQSFSGVTLEENIKYIEGLLADNNLFEYRSTDIYEQVFDLTDEEYINTLKTKQDEIKNDILEQFGTKRKNLYYTNPYSILDRVLKRYRVPRLTHYVGVYTSSDIDYKFFCELFEELIKQNKIVTSKCKNGTGYRAINEAEQKKLSSFISK